MTRQEFTTVDVLRLEIEGDPDGLVNLVQNPNGVYGGWGWLTPVAGSTMSGNPVGGSAGTGELTFTAPTPSAAAHFTTEPLPITAGEWAAASWIAEAVTSNYRARYEWLDAAGALLSSSTQSAYFGASASTVNLSAVQAPASTAYVRLRFDHYSNTSAGNPTAGATMRLREVTVAPAATSGELGTLRVNLVPNPGFVTDTAHWMVESGCTIARSTAQAQAGSASLALTGTGSIDLTAQTLTGKRGIPVTGGAVYTASAYFRAATTTRDTRVTLLWYTSAGAFVSMVSGTQGPNATGSWTRRSVTATAPASAAYATIRTEVWDGALGQVHYVDSVLLEKAATVGTYFDSTTAGGGGVTYSTQNHPPVVMIRTNKITNPSAEVNTTGWTSMGFGTLSRSTTTAAVGAASFRFAYVAAGFAGGGGMTTGNIPVTAGKTYTLSASARKAAGDAAGPPQLDIEWYRSTGTIISTSQALQSPDTDTWTSYSMTAAAPAGAVNARVVLWSIPLSGGQVGDLHYLDAAMLEEADSAGTYFDGATADATVGFSVFDRAWTGTAHASTSTETETLTLPYHTEFASNLGFIEPIPWLDLLSSSYAIKIVREELNLGTLEASIVDSALDPAVADTIRPGRKLRCTAYDGTTWRPLFTGETRNAKATYDLTTNNDDRRAQISLTAVDNTAVLANVGRAGGVEFIDELPFVLEGAGVPWNVNGSGDQAPSGVIVAVNESASALDQVAVTRDSQLGFAWVDTRGVVQVWDAAQLSTTVQATLDETVYTGALVDYDTERCINEVTVHFLRNNGTGTEEVPYGPYVDATSRAQNGPHRAEFRVQWANEDESLIEAYAAAILVANATPVRRWPTVRFPVKSTADLSSTVGSKRALIDLQDLVTVSNAELPLSVDQRVTSITHDITPTKWLVDLGFMVDGSVAQPRMVPSPPSTVNWWPEVRSLLGSPAYCPPNFLVMDGSSFSVSEYPLLAAYLDDVIGLAPGVLPDATDVFLIGAGTKAVGTTGGSATVTIAASHIPRRATATAFGTAPSLAQPTSSGTPTAASPLDVLNPWLAVYHIIRAR